MTSRNEYGTSSGQGRRLFARSDDGGQTWAANWSFFESELPGSYCEGSIVTDAEGVVYYGHADGRRVNYTVHQSTDGGRSFPKATVVYPGGSGYSDMALLKNGSLGIFFEKDGYNTLSFAVIDP
jgi:sialidase-1